MKTKQFNVDDVRAVAESLISESLDGRVTLNQDAIFYMCNFCIEGEFYKNPLEPIDFPHHKDCPTHAAKRLMKECEK